MIWGSWGLKVGSTDWRTWGRELGAEVHRTLPYLYLIKTASETGDGWGQKVRLPHPPGTLASGQCGPFPSWCRCPSLNPYRAREEYLIESCGIGSTSLQWASFDSSKKWEN